MFEGPIMKCQVPMIMHDGIFPLAPVNRKGNGEEDIVSVSC